MSYRVPKFWGLEARPSGRLRAVLAALLFVAAIALYLGCSYIRHQHNEQDKLLPTPGQMVDAVKRMAFEEDQRTGGYLFWQDTASSLKRIGIGVGTAALLGLLLGLNMGLFQGLEALTLTFVTVLSIIPPLAVLPILFMTFGVDEFAKIMLIFIGTFPMICRDVYQGVKKTPVEQITKAITLGASPLQVVYRIILPQTLPRLIDTARLSMGSAWLFLISSEAIASTDGLGYRIFLVRRYLAMDVIIPYVIWITLLGFSVDWLLKTFVAWKFRWYGAAET